jgi:hypothetical protein
MYAYSTAQNGSGVHARWIDGSVVIRAYIKRMGMGLNNMRESVAAPTFSCTHMHTRDARPRNPYAAARRIARFAAPLARNAFPTLDMYRPS